MTQQLSEVLFNGTGYLKSKKLVPYVDEMTASVEFKLNSSTSGGPLLIWGTKSCGVFQIIVGPKSWQVQMIDCNGTVLIQFGKPTLLDLNVWHKISYTVDGSYITVVLDEWTYPTTTPHWGYYEKVYLCIGGNGALKEKLVNTCVRNVFFSTSENFDPLDFNTVGIVTSCTPYVYDTVATQLSGSLACNEPDKCVYKYFTNYTAATSWDKLACCTRYTGNDPCDVGPNSKNTSPILAYQSSGNGQIQCIYDRNKIDSFNQAKKSVTVFGEGNAVQDAYCQSKVTGVCPPDMPDGCSRYFAVDETGDYCRNLFNSKTDAEKDAAILNYCTRNNTNDCKCANRSYNADYVRLKQGNPFSDACWYIPCANSSRYLVPSEFKHAANCPEDICQVVFDIAQAHDVDIDHLKLDINCDFSGGGFPHYSTVMWYYIGAYALAIILLIIYAQK